MCVLVFFTKLESFLSFIWIFYFFCTFLLSFRYYHYLYFGAINGDLHCSETAIFLYSFTSCFSDHVIFIYQFSSSLIFSFVIQIYNWASLMNISFPIVLFNTIIYIWFFKIISIFFYTFLWVIVTVASCKSLLFHLVLWMYLLSFLEVSVG